MKIHTFLHKSQVDENLANDLIRYIKSNYSAEDVVIIALSGGSTPFDMYTLLSTQLQNLVKESFVKEVVIVQVDERYVPSHSSRANQKQLREIFTEPIQFFGMNCSDIVEPLEDAVTTTNMEYQQVLESRGKSAPDIAILGMGEDGHTASLFPENQIYLESLESEETDKIIIGMYVESQNEERISLTSQLINKIPKKILFAYGEGKMKTLSKAVKSQEKGKYPILSIIDNIELYTIDDDLIMDLV